MSLTTPIISGMVAQRKRLIQHFIQAGAVHADAAVAESTLPHSGFRLISKLREACVIRATADGRLYLDQKRLEAVTLTRNATMRRVLAVAVIAVAILLAGIYYLVSAY